MDEKSAGQDEPKEESNLGGEGYAGGKSLQQNLQFTVLEKKKVEIQIVERKNLTHLKKLALLLWLVNMSKLIIQKSF